MGAQGSLLCEGRKASPVWSQRRAPVAQIAEKCNVGYDWQLWEHTVHHSLQLMGLCSCKLTITKSCYNGHVSIRTWPWSNERRWCVHPLPGKEMVLGCIMGKKKCHVILWAKFCLETLDCGIHVNVGWMHTYLNIVAEQIYPFMAVTCLPQCRKNVQEWSEEHDKEFKMLPWPPNSPVFKFTVHMWDVLEIHPPHLKPYRIVSTCYWCLSARYQRTSEILWRTCLDRSELFLQHMGDMHYIEQMASMLWLIGVYLFNYGYTPMLIFRALNIQQCTLLLFYFHQLAFLFILIKNPFP